MVSVLFIGVNHYKKFIIFAIGLIAKENVESYIWVLENFKRAMGRVLPFTVMDQDPTLKVVVSQIFYSMRQRFCMRHIMSKIGKKVSSVLAKDEVF